MKKMTRLPISVCVVSAAEAHRIGKALASVADWTSEIVVVLNEEVTDGTEEIAKSHGAKVIRERWKGMVGQKASAAAKATQEWILDLDADEVVSDALREEIQQALSQQTRNGQVAAFNYPRLSWYCGRWIRHGDWYPDRQTRLWRRGQAHWAGEDPHATLVVQGRVAHLKNDLLHFSMENMPHLVRKAVAYSDDFLRLRRAAGQGVSRSDVWLRPWWRFWRSYVLRLGFLDGWRGFHIAWLSAFYTFLRYARVWEEQEAVKTEK